MASGFRLLGTFLWHSGSPIIVYVTALHIAWSVLVQIHGLSIEPTPLQTLATITGSTALLSLSLFVAAICAMLGAFAPKRFLGLALMAPQQLLLVIMASGAAHAVAIGAYPDGYATWWVYILKDQLPILLLAPGYTFGILVFHNVFRRVG